MTTPSVFNIKSSNSAIPLREKYCVDSIASENKKPKVAIQPKLFLFISAGNNSPNGTNQPIFPKNSQINRPILIFL